MRLFRSYGLLICLLYRSAHIGVRYSLVAVGASADDDPPYIHSFQLSSLCRFHPGLHARGRGYSVVLIPQGFTIFPVPPLEHIVMQLRRQPILLHKGVGSDLSLRSSMLW